MMRSAIEKYLNTHGHDRFDLKTVMFDMDGVLVNSMPYHAKSWVATMEHYGYIFSKEEVYMNEGRTGSGTINSVSMRQRGIPATEEEVEAMYHYKSECFASYPEVESMPGAYDLLRKVKASGVMPMVVTGSGQQTLLNNLERRFPGIFTPGLMVTAYDVRKGKPDPEPYLMGLEKGFRYLHGDGATGGLAPNESIVVENAPMGIRAGVAAGVFVIAVNTGPLPDSVLTDAGANLLFHSMQELCDSWEELVGMLSVSLSSRKRR